MTTVAVSGGFDPLHVGHVRLIQEARTHGDRLVVILHPDSWLMRKKGFVFMPYAERREILLALKGVDDVVEAIDHGEYSCWETLQQLHPDVFCNGGDQTQIPSKEVLVVEQYGGRCVYGVGGGKIQSSSALAKQCQSVQR